MTQHLHSARIFARGRGGYVMLVALVVMALIAIIGATSLQLAGVDQRIASHNQKHMVVFNASVAGTEHGRMKLMSENPYDENMDSTAPDSGDWINMVTADGEFEGTSFDQNLGVYWVEAVFERCGNPPPGYSTEQGRNGYRSDYWAMWATARQADSTMTMMNQTQSTSVATVRKVMSGNCKIR